MSPKFRIFIVGILAALLWSAGAAFSETTEQFHKTFTLKEGTPVEVDNISGKVDISVWDQPTADVQAVKRAHGNSRDLQRVSIDIDTNGRLSIKTRYLRGESGSFSRWFGNWGNGPNVSVDYTIRIPRTALLREVSTVSADITVRDARGEANLHSVSGSIRLTGLAGPVALQSTSGDIEMTGGMVKSAETVSGDLRLRGISGNLSINSTSGDITVDGTGGRVDANSVSGSITVAGLQTGKAETISGDIFATPALTADATHFSSISGDIHLKLPAGANAEVKMDTVSGELRTDNGVEIKLTQISKNHISGRIGSGGKLLSINTTSGDVILDK